MLRLSHLLHRPFAPHRLHAEGSARRIGHNRTRCDIRSGLYARNCRLARAVRAMPQRHRPDRLFGARPAFRPEAQQIHADQRRVPPAARSSRAPLSLPITTPCLAGAHLRAPHPERPRQQHGMVARDLRDRNIGAGKRGACLMRRRRHEQRILRLVGLAVGILGKQQRAARRRLPPRHQRIAHEFRLPRRPRAPCYNVRQQKRRGVSSEMSAHDFEFPDRPRGESAAAVALFRKAGADRQHRKPLRFHAAISRAARPVGALPHARPHRHRRALQRFRRPGARHRGRDRRVLRDQLFGLVSLDRKAAGRGRAEAHPFYLWIGETTCGEDARPRWNFHKYLVGPSGELAGIYPSKVSPLDAALVAEIEKMLP